MNDVLIFQKDMAEPECAEFSGTKHLFIVADGLGGHSRGDLASRTVLELFSKKRDQICDEESLLNVIGLAKSSLDFLARDDFSLFGLGTTIAGLSIEAGRLLIFNCGDCRVYRLSVDNSMARLTKDHSLVQELVDRGDITEDHMRFHPNKNIVTSTITGDLLGAEPRVYTTLGNCRPGEKYLICSDGVWENFDSSEIEQILSLPLLRDCARRLVKHIVKNGAQDNFTLILIEIGNCADNPHS